MSTIDLTLLIVAICMIAYGVFAPSPEDKRKREIEELEHEKRVVELKRAIRDAHGKEETDEALKEYEEFVKQRKHSSWLKRLTDLSK